MTTFASGRPAGGYDACFTKTSQNRFSTAVSATSDIIDRSDSVSLRQLDPRGRRGRDAMQRPRTQRGSVSSSTAPLVNQANDEGLTQRPRPGKEPEEAFSWLAYLSFLFLGTSMLLPWNSTINSTAWLQLRLKDTPILGTFLNWIGVVNTWVTLAVGLVAFLVPRPKAAPRKYDSIQLSLMIIAGVFVAETLLTLVDLEPYALFAGILLLLTVSTVAAGVLQLDVFALVAAEYPPLMMQAISMGQVICAVALSLFSMSAVALDYLDGQSSDETIDPSRRDRDKHGHRGDKDKNPKPPAPSPPSPPVPPGPGKNLEGRSWWLYFFLCFIPVIATLVFYSLLARSRRKYQSLEEKVDPGNGAFIEDGDEANSRVDVEDDDLEWDASQAENPECQIDSATILWDMRHLALSVFFTFSITLAIFPALTATVVSSSPGAPPMYTRLFVPLGFLCSGIGDWVGRSLPARPQWILTNHNTILVLSVARAGFLFLFAGCNLGAERSSPIPPVFAKDVWFFSFVFLFFLSNGYLSTIALMLGPGCVEHRGPEAKGTAGALLSIILFCGLAVGSAASFVVRWFIFGEIF